VKIGIVCYPTFGGSGVVATELGKGLAARGHEVHIVSYAAPARMDPFDERVRLHEVEVSSYPLFRYPPYEVALASRLADVAEAADLDLVHVHYAIPHTLAALLVQAILRPRPFPVVTTLHGTDITVVGQEPSYARVTRFALERSDAVTAVSEWLRRETVRVFETRRPIEVIPNFVDLERFTPAGAAAIRSCFAPRGERVLVHVSNFRPVKRVGKVVEAFAAVRARMPATLVMVGDGPDRVLAEARAKDLGVRADVRFLGAQGDVASLLRAADVLVMPSEFESFGLAALEAMASGVVPIATAAGGLPEVVTDGVDGLLVPEAEIGTLGARVADLCADPARLAAMKAAARGSAERRFGREAVVAVYERLYESALQGAGRGADSSRMTP
jgi:N-acetyl-alpha-D-glucosaminyl L-malate synthase BshA